jgi:hypothetical protein
MTNKDDSHYEYASYTTGRKNDYGHHEYNEENGWDCYDWDRGDYTETMEMKRPLPGKEWKPFRIYNYVSVYNDFLTEEEAQVYFDEKINEGWTWLHLIEVDKITGKEIRTIKKYQKP